MSADAPLSVSQLNARVRAVLQPLPVMRVTGEVSGTNWAGSGHLYFELKDESARVKVTIWKSAAQALRVRPRDGMQVVVTGRADLWVQGGSYSFNATNVELAGEGALFLALQRLKERLTAEGLFDPTRKQQLPFLPMTVALVTSPTGAAVQDMVRILRERARVRILVVPVKVQGEGAAESIAQGIERIDALGWADVILCGRGGGSLEDLWAFNEERVVRAFAACRTPIVSAVGHETDTLLSDLAADWRAPTPTAAAERAVPRFADLDALVVDLRGRATQAVKRQLTTERRHLGQLRARLGDGGALTGQRQLRLEELHRRMHRAAQRQLERQRRRHEVLARRLRAADPVRKLADQRQKLALLRQRLDQTLPRTLERRRQRIAQLTGVLRALSPRAALGRGYAIVRRPDGTAVGSVAGVQVADHLELLLCDGSLGVQVEAVTAA
ncbi:MAG: exodeoxyribonuclease VII large subunit [Deltaproteobacteria bacterium]|nr:exodeoxyribonuclease VII large subunit [Deltaproteobacteria bacterium]